MVCKIVNIAACRLDALMEKPHAVTAKCGFGSDSVYRFFQGYKRVPEGFVGDPETPGRVKFVTAVQILASLGIGLILEPLPDRFSSSGRCSREEIALPAAP